MQRHSYSKNSKEISFCEILCLISHFVQLYLSVSQTLPGIFQNVQKNSKIGHLDIQFGKEIWRTQSLISYDQRLEFKNHES